MTDNSKMPDYSLNTGRKILSGIYKITSPSGKIYIGQLSDNSLMPFGKRTGKLPGMDI